MPSPHAGTRHRLALVAPIARPGTPPLALHPRRSSFRLLLGLGSSRDRKVHEAQLANALIASPISFTPMIRQMTAMIVAFSLAIQSCRSPRILVALSPIRK